MAPMMFVGCYMYVPVEPSAVPPGSEIRARIAAPAAARIAETLGLSDTRLLNGTLVHLQDGGITLSVQTAPPGTVGAPKGIFQNVDIRKPDLLEVEVARLDKTRTGIAAAIVAGGIILGISLLHGQGSTATMPTEPPSNLSRGFLHPRLF